MLRKLFTTVLSSEQQRQAQAAQIRTRFIHDAAQMGGTLFGPVPAGTRREFFCLDRNTWVWHEEWTDAAGQQLARTTRYDIRPHGIFKAQDGVAYQPVSNEEAHRLYAAMRQYQQNLHERFDPLLAAAGV